jgi:hypothetical protein
VSGPVLFREVFDDVGLAGYVYCHISTGSESRAGIVVTARDRALGPSVPFQRQLGVAMLGVHPLTPAVEVVDDVYVEAPLFLGGVARAESIDQLRSL